MRKKLLALLLALSVGTAGAFAFSGCNLMNNGSGSGDGTESETGDKTEDGSGDKTESKPSDKTEDESGDKTESKPSDKTEGEEGKTDGNTATAGLRYTLINDGTEYSISGVNALEDTDVFIPETHNGKPVTAIGESAFESCGEMTSIFIPKSVTSIGDGAFNGCAKLASIKVDAENSKYKSENNCLLTKDGKTLILGCKNSTVPTGITAIGACAFNGCKSITSIEIPNSVTSIGDSAFYSCSNLATVNYAGTVAQWGTIEKGLKWNEKAGNFTIICTDGKLDKDGDTTNGTKGLKFTLNEAGTEYSVTGIGTVTATSIVIPSFYNAKPVTSIGERAFYDCAKLKSVTIPDSVTEIGVFAFYKCSGITSVDIPNSVTKIDNNAFYYCSGLTGLNLPNGITSIGENAFNGCVGLPSIEIPNSLTDIGKSAFYGCVKFTNIFIPKTVTSLGSNAFGGCSAIEKVTVEAGNPNYKSIDNCVLTKDGKTLVMGCKNSVIPDGVEVIGASAFNGCTFTTIAVPASVEVVELGAFYRCHSLQRIALPGVVSIGWSSFSSCEELEEIIFSDKLTTIEQFAIRSDKLKSITLPKSLKYIGNGAFSGCYYLDDIIFTGTKAEWKSIEVVEEKTSTLPSFVIITCTDGKLDKNGKEIK